MIIRTYYMCLCIVCEVGMLIGLRYWRLYKGNKEIAHKYTLHERNYRVYYSFILSYPIVLIETEIKKYFE